MILIIITHQSTRMYNLQDVAKLSGGERDVAERDLKKRTLGITRLIAELYKKSVVKEPVVHVCISELLGSPNEKPLEDNVEVGSGLLTLLLRVGAVNLNHAVQADAMALDLRCHGRADAWA
jgi:hypothetical protein